MEEQKKGKLLRMRLGVKRLNDEFSAAFIGMANYKCCLSLCADFMRMAAEVKEDHQEAAAITAATEEKKG